MNRYQIIACLIAAIFDAIARANGGVIPDGFDIIAAIRQLSTENVGTLPFGFTDEEFAIAKARIITMMAPSPVVNNADGEPRLTRTFAVGGDHFAPSRPVAPGENLDDVPTHADLDALRVADGSMTLDAFIDMISEMVPSVPIEDEPVPIGLALLPATPVAALVPAPADAPGAPPRLRRTFAYDPATPVSQLPAPGAEPVARELFPDGPDHQEDEN